MGKLKTGRIPYLQIGIVIVAVAFLIVGGLLLLNKWESDNGRFPEQEIGDPVIKYDGVEYKLKENVETFLVLGLDTFEWVTEPDSYNNNKQADFLMVIVFDNDAKTYSAIQINRDTMVDINVLGVAGNKVDTVHKQIALAHTYGNGKDLSCHNTANSVSDLLMGIKINHYVSLTMDAVASMNDLVGGVEVQVLDDFTDTDPALVKGETVLLQGEQALTYVRARMDLENSSNTARMERQRQYLKALFAAFDKRAEQDEKFAVEATLELGDFMISDRSATQLQTLAQKLSEYEFQGVKHMEGETVRGEQYMEFYPDKTSIEKIIIELFYVAK